ncbi:hypothetical protein [Rathayibacter festucae]|uniref:hypothetical protein n=1 Tax=Rathayibacter festucae TaxID=110937 RepID=UPI002A6B3AC5|nr:hypothetical protein [Rathayibacter festucae]MDY0914836.1 hypothetical protein [Rathayibacter festucae]
MRNTRTAAACLAATTVLGLLSATPAMAEPLDGGAGGVVQREESGGSGLGLLGRSVTDVPAGQADRGEAGMSDTQQPGGPDARLPGRPLPVAPDEPAPETAPPAQSSFVDVSLSGDQALVTLSDDVYRSDKRIVVIVEGRFVAQIHDDETRGVASTTADAVGGRTTFHIPGVKPGERVAVTEYLGSLDTEFDDSLRRQRLFAGTLGAPAPTTAPPTPTTAPSPPTTEPAAPTSAPAPSPSKDAPAGAPLVTASYEEDRAVISLPKAILSPEKRVDVWVNGVKTADVVNGMNGLGAGVWAASDKGDRLVIKVEAEPGDQVKVTLADVAGAAADRGGSDPVLFEGLMQRVGEPAPVAAPTVPASATAPPAPAAEPVPPRSAADAGVPAATLSYKNRRAVVDVPKELSSAETRVKVLVNGAMTAKMWNGVITGGVSDAQFLDDRFTFAVDAAEGDQVAVIAVGVDGTGAAREGSERVLAEGLMQFADAPAVVASHTGHRAVFSMSMDLENAETRVTVWVNGVKTGDKWNGSYLSGFSGRSSSASGRLLWVEEVVEGDQVRVVAVDVDGTGAAREGSERVLFDQKM